MDTRIVSLAAVIFSGCVTPMPEAWAQSGACIIGAAFDPANPTSAGFGLVFSDEFSVDFLTNQQTIDLTASGNPGFNWYLTKFFGYGTEPASTIAITPDGLVLTPSSDVGGNYNIATAARPTTRKAMSGKPSAAGPISRRRSSSTPRQSIFRKDFRLSGAFPSSTRQIREPITLLGRRPDFSISSRMISSSSISAGLHLSPMGLPFTIGMGFIRRHARKDIAMDRLVSAT